MKKWNVALGYGGMMCALLACATDFFSGSQTYDEKVLSVQSLNLFNQRSALGAQSTWLGNWVFRRSRLAAVDYELRKIRPDIVLMTESMSRKDSDSESDRTILQSGSLESYQWISAAVHEYSDTSEIESLAAAAGVPIRLEQGSGEFRRSLGDGALVSGALALSLSQPIALIQIYLPGQVTGSAMGDQLVDFIRDYSGREKVCPRRIVVAGTIPGDQRTGLASVLIDELGLKDVSDGRCPDANSCVTDTTANEFNKIAYGEHLSTRSNKILVHGSTYVLGSGRNFDAQMGVPDFLRPTVGVQAILPLTHYGWTSTVRLPKCREIEPL
jgi:hypothetical protein